MAQNNQYKHLDDPRPTLAHTTKNKARALVKLATTREALSFALDMVPKSNRQAIEASLKEGMRIIMDDIRTTEGL